MDSNFIKQEPGEFEYEDLPDIVDLENLPEVTKKDVDNVRISHYSQEFTCTICNEKCRFELFKIHGMLHQKTNYCFVCKREIIKDFIGHVTRIHLSNKCSICEKVFISKKSLKKHSMRIHTSGNQHFQCGQCDKSFRLEESLTVHVEYTHLGVKSFTCEVCESTFINSSSLRRHVKKIHSTDRKDEVYECNICFETLRNISLKKSHELAHVSKKACDECGVTFASLAATRNHLKRWHFNTEKCPVCSRILHKTLLKSHMRNVHQLQKQETTFMCTVCCKELASADGLRKHRHQHLIDRQIYGCNQCNKTYIQKSSLSAHIERAHLRSRLKSSICEICESTFSRPHSVMKHMQFMHSDLLMNDMEDGCYECAICFEPLADIQEKKSHELAHVASKTCAICSKIFATVDATRKHLKSEHYNTEKCSHCSEVFHKTMLDSHVWREHKLVECKICHLYFKHYGLLARHKWVHEDIEICDICGCTLNFLNKKRHMQLHLEGKLHRCTICSVSVSNIENHNTKVHRNTEYTYCSRCPEKFSTWAARSAHYHQAHSENYKRFCRICRSKFKSIDELKKHLAAEHKLARHRNRKKKVLNAPANEFSKFSPCGSPFQFKCDSCGFKYRAEKTLKKHKCQSGQYYCHLCDIRYANKAYVKHHMITYHSPRIIRNEKSEDKLEKHRLRQVGMLRGMKRKYDLLRHKSMNVRVALKKIDCQECAFSSYSKGEMRIHAIRKHIMLRNSAEGSDGVDIKKQSDDTSAGSIHFKTEMKAEFLDQETEG